jgi:hypothetical protein
MVCLNPRIIRNYQQTKSVVTNILLKLSDIFFLEVAWDVHFQNSFLPSVPPRTYVKTDVMYNSAAFAPGALWKAPPFQVLAVAPHSPDVIA